MRFFHWLSLGSYLLLFPSTYLYSVAIPDMGLMDLFCGKSESACCCLVTSIAQADSCTLENPAGSFLSSAPCTSPTPAALSNSPVQPPSHLAPESIHLALPFPAPRPMFIGLENAYSQTVGPPEKVPIS